MSNRRAEFTHRALVVIGLVLLAALVATVVVLAADVLLVFFGGILFAVFLRGLGDFVSHHTRLPARLAVVLVIFALALIVGTGSVLLAADISTQLDRLGTDLTDTWRELQARLRREVWGRQLLMLLRQAQADPAGDATLASHAALAFSTTLGAVLNGAIVIFLGIYVALNPEWYRRGLLRLFPPSRRPNAAAMLDAIGHTLRWWLFGRALGMVVVGLVTTLGLLWLDVPLALGLGAIAAALDFVPTIGPIVAAAPAVLVAFGVEPGLAVYVAALYLGIQIVEGYLLTPLIEQRSVRLPPALTIGAQVVMGVLVGAVGVVLATPLTATAVVIIKRLYVEDTLEHASGTADATPSPSVLDAGGRSGRRLKNSIRKRG